jgi:uncharacterized protein
MNDPWYRDGLAFACTGCGDCCTGEPGYVWVTRAEIQEMAAALGLAPAEFQRQFVRSVGIRKSLVEHSDGDCVFFHGENRRCRVYDVRPRQCRTWPFWASNIASPAAWDETARRCPGCNRGRRVPLKKILEQAE